MPIYEVEVDGEVFEADAPTPQAAVAAAKKMGQPSSVGRVQPPTRTAAPVPTLSRLTVGEAPQILGTMAAGAAPMAPAADEGVTREEAEAGAVAGAKALALTAATVGAAPYVAPVARAALPVAKTAAFYAAANAALEKLGLSGETRAILLGTLFARSRQPGAPLR